MQRWKKKSDANTKNKKQKTKNKKQKKKKKTMKAGERELAEIIFLSRERHCVAEPLRLFTLSLHPLVLRTFFRWFFS
jgi:hypothetical protein